MCIDKGRKTHDDKQLYLTIHFTKQIMLNINYLMLTLNVTVQLLIPKTERVILFLNLNLTTKIRDNVLQSIARRFDVSRT